MATFQRSSQTERDRKWAYIWFEKFTAFHQREGEKDWQFTADDVIAFLRAKLEQGVPSWKRLKIVQALMTYGRLIQKRPVDDLFAIHKTLQEIVVRDRATEGRTQTIEEVVGKINSREPDVDGNVAPSTQNQAFHALLFLFEHVFKRDIGRTSALRASKGKQIPTVLSAEEVRKVLGEPRGISLVIAKALYGCGMRISEALQLRVKDIDFDNSLSPDTVRHA